MNSESMPYNEAISPFPCITNKGTAKSSIFLTNEEIIGLIIFANEKAIKQEFPYDMSIEAFMEILRLWSISLKDVFNFLKENPNISYIEKQIFQTPKNKHTEDHQRELLIRGTEELIIYLYKQGVRPEGIKIKNNTDPFFETCKKLTDKYKIWLPFLTREHLT